MKNIKRKVVCYGEILWDNLPTGKKPGGAPMNVAYHLNQLGIESSLISKVGNDKNGEELLAFIETKGLSKKYCQIDETYPTSTVEVLIGDDNEVKYEIVKPVAWDFIEENEEISTLTKNADAFVFGSLATRNATSYNTLLSLLDKATYKVFDVNLRAPHYSESGIADLLYKSDLLKLNIHELNLITSWFFSNCKTEWEKIENLQNKFGISEIVVTKGSSGATYYTKNEQYNYPAYKVIVNDTIGSGDSFLAAFLLKKLAHADINDTLSYAAALGAYVTMHSGACPEYKPNDLNYFIWKTELATINHLYT
ncbi:carbohydrate kinase [Pedobacter aquae]|uniref:Carbohydrate kinase n=1 Tax=Pedobacter aquae TaxID=2605747 RepID=A0A5C0VN63_9SPHI|nr:carbohydrate kinase [Pedobacter aquae]QEK53113.1 carbohydrate kinase [Pedobacter aquae]